jgi:hypothetical protein
MRTQSPINGIPSNDAALEHPPAALQTSRVAPRFGYDEAAVVAQQLVGIRYHMGSGRWVC